MTDVHITIYYNYILLILQCHKYTPISYSSYSSYVYKVPPLLAILSDVVLLLAESPSPPY